ncbi:tRNA (adenosine(37)-N6)-threonylcarbamoyltransferase complex ATPase subunit type 1 TsaE [Candidatus Latescibacterota bacterium]
MREVFTSKDEAETLAIARAFAGTITPGTVVALTGELGAGKTVFARGICEALGAEGDVTSPTFTLIHEHCGRDAVVYHMDFYRLESPEEIVNIGAEDLLYGDTICLVEWAEKMGKLFPVNAVWVTIEHDGGSRRIITIERKDD